MKKIDNLLDIIKEKRNIKITNLEKISKIPRTSLLRYLKELEQKGKVTKEFGEVSIRKSSMETNALPRINSSISEKTKIARIAAQKVKDGDVIFLDAGSTCFYLAKEIQNKNITIYTNNILLSNIIDNFYKPVVYFLPGKINPKTLAISSSQTILNIQSKIFDKCFIGVNSYNENYFYTTNQEEAIIKETTIKQTERGGIFIIGRSNKANENAKFGFCAFNKKMLITEEGGN